MKYSTALLLSAFFSVTAMELDFTTGKIPAETSGISSGDLKNGSLSCDNEKRYRIKVPPEVAESGTMTLQTWFVINPLHRGGQSVLLFSSNPTVPNTNMGFFFGRNNNRLEFKWWNVNMPGYLGINIRDFKANYLPGSEVVKLGQWQQATAVCTPQEIQLYLNGKKVAQQKIEHPITIPGGELNLGIGQFGSGDKARYSHGLWGNIGNVTILGKALSAEEVKADYEAKKKSFAQTPKFCDMEGHDPDFKIKLRQTAELEKALPPRNPAKEARAEIKIAQGVPSLFIDGKQEFPMMFMPSPWGNDQNTFPAVRDFSAAGITLNSDMISTNLRTPGLVGTWWRGIDDYDFNRIDQRFEMLVKANPNARILVRIKMDPPAWWWLKDHPEFVPVCYQGGKYVKREQWCGLTSPEWRKLYSKMLRDFIRHVEKQPYGKHIIGYLPGGGSASEWYYHGQDFGLIDYSPIAQRDFRTWVEKRYQTVEKLNRAWGGRFRNFQEVQIPLPENRLAREQGIFRDPQKSRSSQDFIRFLNETTIDNVANTTRIVKEETGGKKMAGYFYGYMPLARLSTSFGTLQNNGHTALGELLKIPGVDFFATPLDYGRRRGGQPGMQIGNFNGTYALHNKLFWDEADYRTHFALRFFSEKSADAAETEGMLRRTFGQMLAKGHAVWWFALVGNHVFHSDRMMEDMKRFAEIGRRELSRPRNSVAEVALIMDEPTISFLSISPQTSQKFRNLLWKTYENANCSGMPVDLFLSSDLNHPKMKDYKLYIFANQCYITPEMQKIIHDKLAKNKAAALWLYAPGFVTDEKCSLDSMKQLTGLTFKQSSQAPEFAVAGPPEIRYKGFTSIYMPDTPSPDELRKIGKQAGVHVYIDGNDPFNVNQSFLTLHAATGGQKHFRLPGKSYRVFDLLNNRVVADKVRDFSENVPAKTTVIYLLEENK